MSTCQQQRHRGKKKFHASPLEGGHDDCRERTRIDTEPLSSKARQGHRRPLKFMETMEMHAKMNLVQVR
jgi:hypothetical protein